MKKYIAKKFYEGLYKEEEFVSEEKAMKYFKKANLPRISEEEKSLLNRSINLEELIWAINKQKNNKAAGPDELYKSQKEILDERLLKLFNEVLDKAKIPNSWKEATITIIPKEKNRSNKDKKL
uniref:Uncharacterized protein n=1 Tax=Micrurus spixii TaxID=129469 RepID=A0A2D4N418_9SAUR